MSTPTLAERSNALAATETPVVSVLMPTFNHVRYIGAAIESVLAQRCDFPVELLVGDDMSTDGTRAAIEEYVARYPRVVRPVFSSVNRGAQRNWAALMAAARGEFIAPLDGDDYWTDPEKLALQVAFLKANTGCAIVHHRLAWLREETGELFRDLPTQEWRQERTDSGALASWCFIHPATSMMRRNALPPFSPAWLKLKAGDWPTFAHVAEHGWIGYIDRKMAVYRVHSGGDWSLRPTAYQQRAMLDVYGYAITHLSTPGARRAWTSGFLNYCFWRHREERSTQRAFLVVRDILHTGPGVLPALVGHALRAAAKRLALTG